MTIQPGGGHHARDSAGDVGGGDAAVRVQVVRCAGCGGAARDPEVVVAVGGYGVAEFHVGSVYGGFAGAGGEEFEAFAGGYAAGAGWGCA